MNIDVNEIFKIQLRALTQGNMGSLRHCSLFLCFLRTRTLVPAVTTK